MLARIGVVTYGIVCYLIFFGTFLYAIGFTGNVLVPKSIDVSSTGAGESFPQRLIIDLVLLGLFAVQHSVMARQWFKRAWTQIIPAAIERSTYVLLASLFLCLLFWQWRPIGLARVAWDIQNSTARLVLEGLFWIGWGLVLISTFLVDHFDLFGLKQVYLYLTKRTPEPLPFKSSGLYKGVRHPIYLGFLIAFWSTPRMTGGHLLFAIMTTAYILVAIQFEERDLIRSYGERYEEYRQRVAMLIPWRFPRKEPEIGAIKKKDSGA